MATPADIHRSTPGYVYGVAIHLSGERQEEEPACKCPCHLADAPYPSQWYCRECGSIPCRFTTRTDAEVVPYSHEQAILDGTANPQPNMVSVPDFYFITKGNNLDDAFPRRHFKTSEAAEKAVQKLNEEDVIASLALSPVDEARVRAFRDLAGGSYHWFHDSQWWWARKQGRYALQVYDGDGSSYWTTEDDPGEIREEIERGDVERIVDLDTGEDVPFSRHVSVEFAG